VNHHLRLIVCCVSGGTTLSLTFSQISLSEPSINTSTYLAIRQQPFDPTKPLAEIVVVPVGDLERGWELAYCAFGGSYGHYGVNFPGFPGVDEGVGGLAHGCGKRSGHLSCLWGLSGRSRMGG
jgi:hypothetical protein